jgi:HEAT repeat protein
LKNSDDIAATTVENLIRELGDAHKTIQRQAIDELVAIAGSGNPIVTEKLRESMASADRRVRWAAAYALGQIGSTAFAMDSADVLCEAMADDDGDIRWAATNLMVRLGRENLVEIGERLLKLAGNGNRNARKMALYCIRDLEMVGAELLAVVERAVHAPDVHVRLAALSVLSRTRDASGESVRIILECLKSDSDAGVRRAAASALGNIRTASADATAALESAAADLDDESLARAARGSLDRLEKRDESIKAGARPGK